MTKYKICPGCGTKNLPKNLNCTNCRMSLYNVRITDDALEQAKKAVEAKNLPTLNSPSASTKTEKICENCGAHNPPNANTCVCGEDISDVMPTPVKLSDDTPMSFSITSLDGNEKGVLFIEEGEIEIGREASLSDYLLLKPSVSRHHAKLFLDADAKLWIEDIGSKNGTFVNNHRILARTELHDGDELGIGGLVESDKRQDEAAYFIVRIGSCM